MIRATLEWLGGFVIVLAVFFLYRHFTDDLFTNEYWRGFMAATVAGILFQIMKDVRRKL